MTLTVTARMSALDQPFDFERVKTFSPLSFTTRDHAPIKREHHTHETRRAETSTKAHQTIYNGHTLYIVINIPMIKVRGLGLSILPKKKNADGRSLVEENCREQTYFPFRTIF